MKPKKLKRVVIKEELVALTGNYICALILNQFIYWSERTEDTDKFLEEERRRNPDLDIELLHGWVFKKSEELNEELMLGINATTLRRYITKLIDLKLLLQRHNPHLKYDRTLQYRPDIVEIQRRLHDIGYALEGYPLYSALEANLQNAGSNLQNAGSNLQNAGFNLQNAGFNLQNAGAITEITPENTSETTHKEEEAAAENFDFETVEVLPPRTSIEPPPKEKEVQINFSPSRIGELIAVPFEHVAYDWRLRPWMLSQTNFAPEMIQAVWQCNIEWYSLEGSKTPNLKKITSRLKKLDGQLKALDSNAQAAYKELQNYWVVAQAIANPEIGQTFTSAVVKQKQQQKYSSIEQALQKPEGGIF